MWVKLEGALDLCAAISERQLAVGPKREQVELLKSSSNIQSSSSSTLTLILLNTRVPEIAIGTNEPWPASTLPVHAIWPCRRSGLEHTRTSSSQHTLSTVLAFVRAENHGRGTAHAATDVVNHPLLGVLSARLAQRTVHTLTSSSVVAYPALLTAVGGGTSDGRAEVDLAAVPGEALGADAHWLE